MSDESKTPSFSLTDAAADFLCEVIRDDGKDPAVYGLQLGVQGGGCSGFEYVMDLGVQSDGDYVFTHKEAQVFIDPRCMPYLDGANMDYVKDLQSAGFKIDNPNAKGCCGCGSSFSCG